MRLRPFLLFLFGSLLFSFHLLAQQPSPPPGNGVGAAAQPTNNLAASVFNNIKFSASLAFLNYREKYLENAEIRRDKVYSSADPVGSKFRFLLMADVPLYDFGSGKYINAMGLSVALKPGADNNVLDPNSGGIGGSIFFNDRIVATIGIFKDRFKAVDPDFKEGKIPPDGETEILYKEKDHFATYFSIGKSF